jgi:hypothetical protein
VSLRTRCHLLNLARISSLLGLFCVMAFAGTITGNLQTPSGLPVKNGTLTFALTQAGMSLGTGLVVPSPVSCYTSTDGTVVGLPNPLAMPVAAVNTLSGSLPAGTYYVQVAFYAGTSSTTTLLSPELPINLTSTGKIIVNAPVTFPAGATGMAVYIGSTSGSETLQGVTVGPTAQFTQATALTSGSAAPGANNTACLIAFNDTIIPYVGYNVSLTSSNGQAYPGFPQAWQMNGGPSGTINVSAGTPLWNGTTVYPTAIVSVPLNHGRQSISGPLAATQFLSGTISGLTYVDGLYNTNIANGLAAAGSAGALVIPPVYLSADSATYTNSNNVPIFNWAMGSLSTPVGNLTFSRNRLFLMDVDNTLAATQVGDTCCGGRSPVGVGNASPVVHLELLSSGTGTVGPLYTHGEALPGYGGYMFGTSLNVEADRGSAPLQLFHNMLLADNSGWSIVSCTRVSNIATCTVNVSGAPLTSKPGDGLYISGNSGFNTGAGIAVLTGVTASTVTFSQTGANTTVAGGVLSPNHIDWSLEVNAFNNSHDPGAVSPIITQNVTPFWGITSTSDGSFPLSAAFFANSGLYYEGFLCQGSMDACFVAGYPTPGGGTNTSHGLVLRPQNVATNGTNYQSMDVQFVDSTYDASSPNYRERGVNLAYIPVSNAADAAGALTLTAPGAIGSFSDSLMLNFPIGTAGFPTYAFNGASGSGMYADGSGNLGFSTGGTSRATITSAGVNSTCFNAGTASWCSGAGAPGGSCTVGSLFSNTTAASASTVLYVCQPANTWTPVTVP